MHIHLVHVDGKANVTYACMQDNLISFPPITPNSDIHLTNGFHHKITGIFSHNTSPILNIFFKKMKVLHFCSKF